MTELLPALAFFLGGAAAAAASDLLLRASIAGALASPRARGARASILPRLALAAAPLVGAGCTGEILLVLACASGFAAARAGSVLAALRRPLP